MSDLQPVFCGNFEYDASVREIERLFDDFGPVDRVDMKTGFAFVFMKDSRDGDDAIRSLDGTEFGRRRRPLRVEWAKGNGETKRREEQRRKNCTPTDTLFVVNFDPDTTHERQLEEHFAPYGKLKRVQVKKNYGFVQYELLDDAIAARAALSLTRLNGRTITVEYVARDPDGRSLDERNASHSRRGAPARNYSPPPRRRSRSPDYGGGARRYDRDRSLTPPRRRDYRRSPSPVRGRNSRGDGRRYQASPARSLSPSLSPRRRSDRSPSPGGQYQDANSRAVSRSRSRSRSSSASR